MRVVANGALLALALAVSLSQASFPARWAGGIAFMGAAFLLRSNVWTARVTALAAGLLAYLGAGSLPWSPVRLAVAMAAVGGVIVAQEQSRRRMGTAALGLAIGASVGAVAAVLAHDPASAVVASRLAGLATGLGLGFVAYLAASAILTTVDLRGRRRGALTATLLVVVAALASAWRMAGKPPSATALPGDGRALARLSILTPNDLAASERARAIRDLEWLVASGHADAGYALAALALEDNADPPVLRRLCPRVRPAGELGSLSELVSLGQEACEAARQWPEEGARGIEEATGVRTAGKGRAALLRLSGDLLMEAGLLASAEAAYRSAARDGDAYAVDDALRALVSRGRLTRATPFADRASPRARLWLDGREDDAGAWRAWNQAMDFSGLEPLQRTGATSVGVPAELASYYAPDIDRRAVMVMTFDAYGTLLDLPLPPGRSVPAALTLQVQNRRVLNLRLENEAGDSLIFGCDALAAAPRQKVVVLPADVCAGQWAQAHVRPAALLAGPLRSMQLTGNYALARIVGEPQEATP